MDRARIAASLALLLAGASCEPRGEPEDGPPPTAPWRLPPRLAAAAAEAPQPAVAGAPDEQVQRRIAERLEHEAGPVLLVGEGADLGRWSLRPERLAVAAADELAALRARRTDPGVEAALAARLHDRGIGFLLVARDLAPAPGGPDDDADRILHRLARAWPLDWFHPVLIGPALVLHRIAPPLVLDAADGERLLAYVRTGLVYGHPPLELGVTLPDDAGGLRGHEVRLAIRRLAAPELAGRPILREPGRGSTLRDALHAAIAAARAAWPARVRALASELGVRLPGALHLALPEVELELEVVRERTELLDRDPARLPALIAPGLHGLTLTDRRPGAGRQHTLFPPDAIRYDHPSSRRLVEHLSDEQAGLTRDAWQDRDQVTLTRFRTHDVLEAAARGPVVELRRATAAVHTADSGPDALRAALVRGGRHLVRHQARSGQFLYRYEPHRDRWSLGPRLRQQARAIEALLRCHPLDPSGESLAAAWRGLEDIFGRLRCGGTGAERHCFLRHHDAGDRVPTAEVAAVAWTVLALLRLGELQPLDPSAQAILAHLATHLLQSQDANGHLRQYFVPASHPHHGCAEPAATGQILLALARLHQHTGEARYRTAFERGAAYHVEQWRRARERGVPAAELRDPAAWLVLALAAMHAQTGDAGQADLALELQGWLDQQWLLTATRTTYADELGGGWRPAAATPDAAALLLTASRAAALSVAQAAGRPDSDVAQRLRWGLRYALQLQYRDAATTAYYLPKPWMVLGAVRTALDRSAVRTATLLDGLLAFDLGRRVLERAVAPEPE